MRNKLFILAAVLLILLSIPAAAQTGARVQSFSGKVEIQPPGGSWTPVSTGQEIPTGATISTGFRSQAVLEVGSAVLEVKPLTRMRLDELIQKEGVVKTELYLRVGRVKADVKKTSGLQQDFRLRSPVSTAAVRGTTFSYDGYNLEVAEGVVAFINAYGQSAGVPAGVSITSDGIEVPPEVLDALEQEYGVSISTAQIADLVDAFDNLPVATTGSAVIAWTTVLAQ